MKIVIGGDHAGYALKEVLLPFLEQRGHEVLHVGSFTPDQVDFPDIAQKVCRAILSGEAERGIMVCGTGVGAAAETEEVALTVEEELWSSPFSPQPASRQAVRHRPPRSIIHFFI